MSREDEDWNGKNRRHAESDVMAEVKALRSEFKILREAFAKHEPTLTDITERAAYWSGVKDDVVKGLLKSGVIAAIIIMLTALWSQFKDHIK